MPETAALPAKYDAAGVELRWQETWEGEGAYRAEVDRSREPYVIACPPPNVTGELHIGHALQAAIQDSLTRLHRMRGYNALWQPGYDHAGIATQNVVERELRKEGKSRHDLGREAFVARVWEWLELYGRTILQQYRRLGSSLDYSRERFTMDDGYVRAVTRFFVHLYEKGYIYRANRIINWCMRCATAISDLEVAYEERDHELFHVRYPLADGSGGISIATARPETILADVAVAVHPDDERYAELVGREVVVPVVNRTVPVIADRRVDPEFGTGALKITPGHDPLDFEIGEEHGLPQLTVIGFDGLMNEEAGDFAGMSLEEAAEAMAERLDAEGALERREPYRHSVATCDRCGTRIEPLLSLQWWCEMGELAQHVIEAVESEEVRMHPANPHRRVVLETMRSIRPWCVSRQLWWGHQIPVWYCPEEHVTVAEEAPAACASCGNEELRREEDVLDTWFSSALWPFATLGWPEKTEDLEYFHPTNVLTTDRGIIFLWVTRMIWSALELLDERPFSDVVVHSTVLLPDGRRMSKSLGTGIDPLELIDEYGADATRYGLLKNSAAQDVRFSAAALEEGKRLVTKLWNVSRLILSRSEGASPSLQPESLVEHWMLARLSAAQREVDRAYDGFDYPALIGALYHLTFDDFCDWYAEAIKPRLYEDDGAAQATALASLEWLLKLLHPVMPHVTEEIWSHLPEREGRLIVAPWQQAVGEHDDVHGALDRVREAAVLFRRSGVQLELEPGEREIFDAVVKPDRAPVEHRKDPREEIATLRAEVERADSMLANENFVSRAPEHVVQETREKREQYARQLEQLTALTADGG